MARPKAIKGKISAAWEQDDGSADERDFDHEEGSSMGSDEGLDSSTAEVIAEDEGIGFAQYLDSEDEAAEDDSQLSSSEDDDDDDGPSATAAGPSTRNIKKPKTEEDAIRQRMEKVPFATLLKARRAMRRSGSGSDDDAFSEGDDEPTGDSVAAVRKRERLQRELEKRENKHAPTEMSSRKPVSRKRSVIDAPSTQRRDPRFSSLSGSQVNAGLFANSYGFLREQQSGELGELRKLHKQLRRQEAHHAGPRAKSEVALNIRAERERIEQALRREEGRENERSKREREAAVLRNKKKEIDEHVKKGGKRYYLKDSEKKRLILEDKFRRLSGTTGTDSNAGNAEQSKRGALQRAVERRRKKNAARDHKMPLGGGAVGGGARFGFDSRDALPPSAVPKRLRLAEAGGSGASREGPSASSTSSQRGPRKRGRRG